MSRVSRREPCNTASCCPATHLSRKHQSSSPNLPPVGFLAVEVNIHRPPGDPYNPRTWPFPLIHELVPGSRENQIVSKKTYDDDFISRFVDAGKKLAERGCVGIITSCGFLAMAQRQLSERIGIPIATSALVQIPSVRAFLGPEKVIGVLTYDGDRLSETHLREIGADPAKIRIRGLSATGHTRKVIQDGVKYDGADMEREMVDSAVRLVESIKEEGKEVGALVLECTQMPPYAAAIQEQVGVPVYDVYTMGMWFYSGLVRKTPVVWMV
ncbi:hypothetical protein B0J12DRAFT_121186 [Macrophomina phaseolina]|uniref:Asp/Glu/hydantoin racemase n=1 Tax=Macrophomina phaseolina TaxID=35725 RepID=A0ABQ8GAM0_9PEZI|nr:hypothetical protein B0J12DRAFT_121186 [Macrophomina phaseolina]